MFSIYRWSIITAAPACGLMAQSPGVQMREAFTDLPGVRIWYVDSGRTGTPVVFPHAATGGVRVWENQIEAFTSAGFRFIAYDRRRWGRSVFDASAYWETPEAFNRAVLRFLRRVK